MKFRNTMKSGEFIKSHSRILVWVLAVLIIVALGVLGVLGWPKQKAAVQAPLIESADNTQSLLQLLPGLPMEKGAAITQNFQALNPKTGRVQYTLAFLSQRSLGQNFDIYKQYFSQNNWLTISVFDQDTTPNLKSMSVSMGQNRVNVSFQSQSGTLPTTIVVGYWSL